MKQVPSYKLGFAGNVTLDMLVGLAVSSLARLGVDAEAHLCPFGAAASEMLDEGSELSRFAPDALFLHLEARVLFESHLLSPLDTVLEGKLQAAELAAQSLEGWVAAFRMRFPNCSILISNLAPPPCTGLGSLEGTSPHSVRPMFRLFEQRLEVLAASDAGVGIVDCRGAAERMGYDRWADERLWYLARMPYSQPALRELAGLLAHRVAALRGKTRKVLVLDLDNTLWGGVVGEDGPRGITLGDAGPGRAYQDFQREVRTLSRRGVVLAVSSKNNAQDALEVLENHPGMLLRPGDFAALKMDWRDKPRQLEELSAELGLGLDSFVFVDDNPAERLAVGTRLPLVAVLELPEDPALYAKTLRESPLFTQVGLTVEDAHRGKFYAAEAGRARLKQQSATLEEYYRSLDMRLRVATLDGFVVGRLSQLTQRTNQFNLTTRRYSEPEIERLMASSGHEVLAAGLVDVFGDNGIVGLCIVEKGDEAWTIDVFLLSCRVIGRTFETGLLSIAVDRARAGGARKLAGRFVPTGKNAVAADFFESHGFSREGEVWTLDLAEADVPMPGWIHCEQRGLDNDR